MSKLSEHDFLFSANRELEMYRMMTEISQRMYGLDQSITHIEAVSNANSDQVVKLVGLAAPVLQQAGLNAFNETNMIDYSALPKHLIHVLLPKLKDYVASTHHLKELFMILSRLTSEFESQKDFVVSLSDSDNLNNMLSIMMKPLPKHFGGVSKAKSEAIRREWGDLLRITWKSSNLFNLKAPLAPSRVRSTTTEDVIKYLSTFLFTVFFHGTSRLGDKMVIGAVGQ